MTAVPFDTLKLARRLRDGAGFTNEHAEAAAEALADAMGADLVTKEYLDGRFDNLEQRITIRLGSMLIVAVGIMLAAMRYFPPHL